MTEIAPPLKWGSHPSASPAGINPIQQTVKSVAPYPTFVGAVSSGAELGAAGSRPDTDARREREFVIALESVRGLAALAVALFHSFHFLPVDGARIFAGTFRQLETVDQWLMRLIMVPFNGAAAVTLFFVLSGFVLTLSLRRDNRPLGPKLFAFCGRRIFRIYPALAVNLLVTSAALYWLPAIVSFPVDTRTTEDLVSNLLLLGTPINGASWTLRVELLAIPFLIIGYLVARRLGLAGILALLGLSILVLFSPRLGLHLVLSIYLFTFFLGMLVAELFLGKALRISAGLAKAVLPVALFVMLSARFLLGYGSNWSVLTEGIAGAVLVGILVGGPRLSLHSLLEMRPIRFIGRISYSYYLYHPMALLLLLPAIIHFMSMSALQAHPFLGSTLIAATTVVAALPLAWASFVLVEKPMIRIGRRL
jgi:peptidoglycan/LPS O-acetylase OafA/YrhL